MIQCTNGEVWCKDCECPCGFWSLIPLSLSPMSHVEGYEYILFDHLHELAHRKIVDIDPERILDLARSRFDPEEAVGDQKEKERDPLQRHLRLHHTNWNPDHQSHCENFT